MAAEGPLDSRRIVRASPKLAEAATCLPRTWAICKFEDVSAAWAWTRRG